MLSLNSEQQQNQKEMYYVPCRWSTSGWKYVMRDPAQHGYFNNPNR